MKDLILKRNGKLVEFDKNKINNAINRARIQTGEFEEKVVEDLVYDVVEDLKDIKGTITVDMIQDQVEKTLIKFNKPITAKAYIIYREKRDASRKPDIFKYRLNLKPFEYPELAEYKEAIQHSYWVHTEFNYTKDIQDFKVVATEAERNAIKNSMLAIAQVEVAVKTFWGDLYHRMPKPEIGSVGYTFAESEVRHHDAYSHLLEILGLNDEFETLKEIPELMQRVNYLTKANALAKTGTDRDYTLALLLFSLFIEHVSLFSQFLIILSFDKYKNLFKGMSNVIEATSKEEQIHGLFGIELINVIRDEHPEWFDRDMEREVYDACRLALESEEIVIDWIYEKGDIDFMPKKVVKEFVKNRLNNSLVSVGYEKLFEVDEEAVDYTDWFEVEIVGTKHNDFFNKRSTGYTKKARAVQPEDLF